uniref:Serpentine receptor class gamma n=1 Tax=Heterorhabditis bacteriophora TaxID=37862 RepID=A0A1I7WPB6_HETBA
MLFSVRSVVSMGALLPGLGCYFCIAYTYLFQFEKVLNFTQSDQCPNVHSILPPVSYSIGVWEPQKFFWLFIMFLHIPPRIFFLVLYRRLFLNSAPKSVTYYRIVSLYTKTLWAEPIGLIMVSVVDIYSHFGWKSLLNLSEFIFHDFVLMVSPSVIHAISYSIWIISFNFNMLFNIILHHFAGIRDTNSLYETTWRVKFTMFITGLFLSLSTAISYPLFMKFCSSTAYMSFSVAEYLLVGYNSFFYCLAYWEFPKTRIIVGVQDGTSLQKIRTISTIPNMIDKIPL